MASTIRTLLLAIAVVLATAPVIPAGESVVSYALEDSSGDVKLDRTKVRHGSASKFDPKKSHKVGTIRSKDVYDETSQVKTIKKEGIDKGTARYNQLMKEATTAYKAAMKKVAKDKSLSLIVEEGGISGYDHVTDHTSDVIDAL